MKKRRKKRKREMRMKKKNIENENEQRTEISSNAELVNSINENCPDKHREEFREEIIYLNQFYLIDLIYLD